MKNLEAEHHILYLILDNNKLIEEIIDILQPIHFFDKNNMIIYSAMINIYKSSLNIDYITLTNELKKINEYENIGGANKIIRLQSSIISFTEIKLYCFMIIDAYKLRQILVLADKIKKRVSTNEDWADIIKDSIFELENIDSSDIILTNNDLDLNLDRIINDIQERQSGIIQPYLQSTFFPSINRFTDTLMPGNMVGIEARDKMGKTTLATNLTLDFALQGEAVAIFSLENGFDELVWKILSTETGIDYGKLRNPKGNHFNNSDMVKLKESTRIFKDTKIFIYEYVKDEIDVFKIVKRLKSQYNLKWFVLDYVGILDSSEKAENRERTIASLTKFFKKEVAKKLHTIPCIISQQNRKGDTAESLGLRRDCDFLFMVEKPYDLQREINREMNMNNPIKPIMVHGVSVTPTANDYLVTMRRSRHTKQYQMFLASYKENKFREVDLYHQQFDDAYQDWHINY